MLPPPPRNDAPGIFARLGPGTFFGSRRNLAVSDLVSRGGKYTIQIEYVCPLSREFMHPTLQVLPALWRDTPSLWSEKVALEIDR
jgi:hypothetical protein